MMPEISKETPFSGRSNTVLVLGQGDNVTAVISTVIARARERREGDRLRFSGPGIFSEKTTRHVEEVVLAASDGILSILGRPQMYFDISIVNLGAASINEIGLTISGFSADTAVLLAILSAALQIPVSTDTVSTGHIASPDGDIRMVKGLPAKIEAAVKTESISTFIHPAIDQDLSLDLLSPVEKERVNDSLTRAKQDLNLVAVRDMGDLVRVAFADEQVVLSGLRQGFYDRSLPYSMGETPIEKASEFLAKNNEPRFWRVLERRLLEGRSHNVRELLLAIVTFFLLRKTYPRGIGTRLLRLVISLPPETRLLKLSFPLLSMSDCIQLIQFAQESDHEDVLSLLKASSGDLPSLRLPPADEKESIGGTEIEKGNRTLQFLLSEMDYVKSFGGLPIDSARASYITDSVIIQTHDQFIDSITSFYIHLLRRLRNISEPFDLNAAGADALSLLERAFSRQGGFKAALAEARNAPRGGLRFVFDLMMDQLKREEQEKHMNLIFKSTLDPLDWARKVALIKALLERLKSVLPSKILSQPPEKFAQNYEMIVKAYVQSFEQLRSFLRSL